MEPRSTLNNIVIWKAYKNIFSNNQIYHYVRYEDRYLNDIIFDLKSSILFKDEPLQKNVNILYIPFMELSILDLQIKWDIKPDVLEYLNKNNFKIIYSYSRESIDVEDDWFKHLARQGNYVLYNSYEKSNHPNALSVKMFDIHYRTEGNIRQKYLRHTTDTVFFNKQYKISALFGRIESDSRPLRRLLFDMLMDEGILYSDDVVYTYFNQKTEEIKSLQGEKLDKIYDMGYEWGVFDEIKNSALNIVVETNPKEGVYTEKLLKPIIAGVPFVWQLKHNFNEVLIDMGYKLYPFIDYSYDSVVDPVDRTRVLFSEITRLYKLDLNSLAKEHISIARHNQSVFANRDIKKELYDTLSKTF